MLTIGILMICGLVVVAVIFVLVSIPSWRRWGATDEEFGAHYPHDDLAPGAKVKAVRAITINAPVKEVWPWVAQIGRGAGWYAIEFLDNRGCKSAAYLMDIPEPALGDQTVIGRLVSFQENDHVAFSDADVSFMGTKCKFCIGHAIRPVDANRTRLLLIARISMTHGSSVLVPIAVFLNDIMETIMGVTQLKNLKRLIETYPERLKRGDIHRVPGRHGHQKYDYTYAGEEQSL